jgi:hypothetical protein
MCYFGFFSSPWLLDIWLLFSNPSLKFQLNKVEGRCWRVGLRYQIIGKGNVYSVWFILFPMIAAYLTFFFKPAREIQTWYLIRLMEAADGWVQDVYLDLFCSTWLLLAFIFQSHPWNLNLNFVWLRVDADGWVLDVSIYIYQRCCSIKLIVYAYKILVLPCITQLPLIWKNQHVWHTPKKIRCYSTLKNMGRLSLGQVSRGNNMGSKGYILKVFGLTGGNKGHERAESMCSNLWCNFINSFLTLQN